MKPEYMNEYRFYTKTIWKGKPKFLLRFIWYGDKMDHPRFDELFLKTLEINGTIYCKKVKRKID